MIQTLFDLDNFRHVLNKPWIYVHIYIHMIYYIL